MDEAPLIDYGNYPEIDCTALADAYSIGGGNARFVFFDWYKVDGVFQRRIVGTLKRPLAGLLDDQKAALRAIDAGPPMSAQDRMLLHAH